MKQIVEKTIQKYSMINNGDKILCGVSGGADSVCMLHLLLKLREKYGFSVAAAHLNHMLRGDESVRDAEFVKDLCKKLSVELFYREIDVNALAKETKSSVELAARNARYSFFEQAKKELNATKIATAHNADDNLETVIMHLIRGSSLNGLGGIPPIRGDIIRPIINISREEIIKYISDEGLDFVEDSTNAQSIYTRNVIRHEVIPKLRELNPKLASNTSVCAQGMREDESFLRALAEKEYLRVAKKVPYGIQLDLGLFNVLSPVIAKRVLVRVYQQTVNSSDLSLEFCHISDIMSLAYSDNPSGEVHLPGQITASKRYEKMLFSTKEKGLCNDEIRVSDGVCASFGNVNISVTLIQTQDNMKSDGSNFYIPFDKEDSVIIRQRKTGDKIKLKSRPSKSLKNLFIDEKLPKDVRDFIPVIVINSKVCGVYGFGVDESIINTNKEKTYYIKMWGNTYE